MKLLLLAGGVLFFIVGVLLLIAALIAWFAGRKRVAAQSTAPTMPPPQPQPQPVASPHPVAPPPPMATVVLDVKDMHAFGSLHGTSGALAGRTINIEARGFYIGRDATVSQVVIEDPRVSKRHVWVGVRDGAVMAVDEGSTNGTYLNNTGNRIKEARLSNGDTLIISQDVTRLTYQQ
jgi:hypothetical protein